MGRYYQFTAEAHVVAFERDLRKGFIRCRSYRGITRAKSGRLGSLTSMLRRVKKTVSRVAKLFSLHSIPYLPLSLMTYHLIQRGRFTKLGIPLRFFVLPNGMKCLIDEEERFITFDHIFTTFGDIFENHEYSLLEEYQPALGDIIFDVGAFVGLYTLLVSKYIGSRGTVYAFEPMPISYRFLRENIRINELSNVIPANIGLADHSGYSVLYVPRYYATASIVNERSGSDHYIVRIDTMDSIVRNYGLDRIDILKVDVEGAELMVIKGARNSLKTIVNRIVVEAHDNSEMLISRRIVETLRNIGFNIEGIYIPTTGATKKIIFARKCKEE